MWVAKRDPIAIEQAEEEAEHDFAITVALRFVDSPHRFKTFTLDVLGHEHAPRRKLGVDPRHADERMPAHQPLDPALVLCFELVVELLTDSFPHFRGHR